MRARRGDGQHRRLNGELAHQRQRVRLAPVGQGPASRRDAAGQPPAPLGGSHPAKNSRGHRRATGVRDRCSRHRSPRLTTGTHRAPPPGVDQDHNRSFMVVAPPLALAALSTRGLIAAAGDRGEVSLDRAQSVGARSSEHPEQPDQRQRSRRLRVPQERVDDAGRTPRVGARRRRSTRDLARSGRGRPVIALPRLRVQQLREADAVEELLADAVGDGEGHLGAVVGGINYRAERAFACGRIDDGGHRAADLGRVGVGRIGCR